MGFHGGLLQLLHGCATRLPSLSATKAVHALSVTNGLSPVQPIFIYNNIISQYFSLGQSSTARKLFDTMPYRNSVSYNIMISAYNACGHVEQASKMFCEMRVCGFDATERAVSSLLSCARLDIDIGVLLHSLVIRNGLYGSDAFVGTSLLGFYGRNGMLEEAWWTFEDMRCRSLVTWNSMICLLGDRGWLEESVFLFREMVRTGVDLSGGSFAGVLSVFSRPEELEIGELLHGFVVKNGFSGETLVMNLLMNMYVKCDVICSAEKIFEEVEFKDVVSWNTIIGAISKIDGSQKVVELFYQMSRGGVRPNEVTFVSLISYCRSLVTPNCGESVHAKIIQHAYDTNVFVGSALVDFYAKCDNLKAAHLCFHKICEKNVVSWNALISGYSNNYSPTAVLLLREMLHLGYRPNEYSFSTVLKSSSAFEAQQLHCLAVRMGFEQDCFVLSSLIMSYARSDLISDALAFVTSSDDLLPNIPSNSIAGIYNRNQQYYETLRFLCPLEKHDIISWNIVIAAFGRMGYYRKAFEVFQQMHLDQVWPDNYTFVSLLSMCTKLCDLALGSSLHGYIIKTDFSSCDTFACNVLLDMYGKCGSVESSVKIFEEIRSKNLITWTALISALGVNGYVHEALERFREMVLLGIRPDGVAFTAVLTACRRGGLVRDGLELFRKMVSDFGVEPKMDHYQCVVDLVVKGGLVAEAENLIISMPFPPNMSIWRCFLDGCKRNGKAVDREQQAAFA